MKLKTIAAITFATMMVSGSGAIAQPAQIGAELVADGFDQPVLVTAPHGDDRLFVVDQPGRIFIIQNGQQLDTPFLDITRIVRSGGERGLLGLAFHPDYATNGRFFVNYTDSGGNTRVDAYQVSADPNVAAADTRTTLLYIEQPAGNHNGGWIDFGPDGYLYIATGDGGGGNDTYGNGQNPESLLAKILRINIDAAAPYAIPRSNPWAGGGGVAEAFVWGVRNPWRVAFDGNDIYIADVGQGEWEEVTVITTADAGANLGWPIMEGAHCVDAGCATSGLTQPIYEYAHSEGCSITGGYVYRGNAIPALAGHYFFGDYCSGFVRSFRYANGAATDVTDWTTQFGDLGRITSFGRDGAGELYIVVADGRIFRIVPR